MVTQAAGNRHAVSNEFWRRAIETTQVGFKANRLRSVQVHEFEAQAARVLFDGRLGYASTTNTEVDKADLINRAMLSAQHGRRVGMTFPTTQLETATADPALPRLSPTELALLGDDMIAIIRRADSRVAVEMDMRLSHERAQIHNSEGGDVSTTASRLTADVWIERHQGDEALVLFETMKSSRLDESHCRFAKRIAQRLIWATQAAQVNAGQQSIILSPSAVAVLLRPLVLALSGARARHGSSPLSGKRGQKLFDERLTVIDDGTLQDRPNGGTADHEGVPAQRTMLIRNGVLENFYYDLRTAALAGTSSTGNGRREMLAPPSPQPTNIVLSAGQVSLDAMIASSKDGLLVDQLLGGCPASVSRGAFSHTIGLGYRIKHGQIIGYVKGAALAGNLYDMLKDLLALSTAPVWVGDVCVPYIQVPGLNVTV